MALAYSSSRAGTCVFLEAQYGNLSIAKKPQEPCTGLEQGWKGGADHRAGSQRGFSPPRQEWEAVPQERAQQTRHMQSFE